jgi:hypothetical protein
MNSDNHNDNWDENDATWQLLGKAAPKEASPRFTDDVMRAVRLLPEAEPIWPKILKFSRWTLAAACVVLAASIFLDPADKTGNIATKPPVKQGEPVRVNHPIPKDADHQAEWARIEDVAQAELLAAAAEHLDEFSDQDLITMIGF